MTPIHWSPTTLVLETSHPTEVQRDVLAALMLDAYRNTIDDEDEDLEDAQDAVDYYLATIIRHHSFVVTDGNVPVAFAFVAVVNGLLYIDPVVVAADRKRQGLGTAVVQRCLRSIAGDGTSEVGATITDGNLASERLFMQLGFDRRGPWP